jgi:hypothetical protein
MALKNNMSKNKVTAAKTKRREVTALRSRAFMMVAVRTSRSERGQSVVVTRGQRNSSG